MGSKDFPARRKKRACSGRRKFSKKEPQRSAGVPEVWLVGTAVLGQTACVLCHLSSAVLRSRSGKGE
jgi:hypothetical protein